jgi:hypothetical protein
MGPSSGSSTGTTHPYVSALNVANTTNAISFRSSTDIKSTGSQIAAIGLAENKYLKIQPGERLYIDGHYGMTNLGGTVNVSDIKSLTFYKGILVGIAYN